MPKKPSKSGVYYANSHVSVACHTYIGLTFHQEILANLLHLRHHHGLMALCPLHQLGCKASFLPLPMNRTGLHRRHQT